MAKLVPDSPFYVDLLKRMKMPFETLALHQQEEQEQQDTEQQQPDSSKKSKPIYTELSKLQKTITSQTEANLTCVEVNSTIDIYSRCLLPNGYKVYSSHYVRASSKPCAKNTSHVLYHLKGDMDAQMKFIKHGIGAARLGLVHYFVLLEDDNLYAIIQQYEHPLSAFPQPSKYGGMWCVASEPTQKFIRIRVKQILSRAMLLKSETYPMVEQFGSNDDGTVNHLAFVAKLVHEENVTPTK